MFSEMRAALGIPKSTDILDHIRSLPDTTDTTAPTATATATATTSPPPPPFPSLLSPRATAQAKIRAIELNAMNTQRPQPGLVELMTYLSDKGVRKALCTRNFMVPVQHLLETFLPGQVFEPVITRETVGVAPKPRPDGIWRIAAAWGVKEDFRGGDGSGSRCLDEMQDEDGVKKRLAEEADPLELARRVLGAGLIMVGDSVDDIAAGHRAGAATVLLSNEFNGGVARSEETDLVVERLDELVGVLDRGFVGRS